MKQLTSLLQLSTITFFVLGLFYSSLHAQENPKELSVEIAEGVLMEFVLVPAGTFQMGSDSSDLDSQNDEYPQREVTISRDFYLGKYEVTQSQWEALMQNNPSVFKGQQQVDEMPVDRVSWNDCMEFIGKLNELERGTFSLPTEAQWEYACRAGTKTRFDWGDDPAYKSLYRYAWFYSRAEGRSHPVGKKQPNPWGLYDMYGNHWEWCADWKAEYPGRPETDPQGAAEGKLRIIRGGSWFNDAATLRAANRNAHEPESQQTNIGLRLVWEPNNN